jgi:hypothetical protein
MIWLKIIGKIFRILNAEATPKQIAGGVALGILNQFGSDESLVQGKIDILSGIVASKTGKSKAPAKGKEKGLGGILPGLIRK